MSQIFRIKLSEDAKLLNYEEKIICKYSKELLLPLTVVRDESGEYIDYLADGYVPFNKYNVVGLGSVFTILQTAIESLILAKRHLLNPFRFFTDTERILISCVNGRTVPLFGRDRTMANYDENELSLLLPMLNELSMLRDVACAKEAMESVYNKIRDNNPGLKDILKIVYASEREWSLILPAGFTGQRDFGINTGS